MNFCGVGLPTNGRGGYATEGRGAWGNGNENGMNFINAGLTTGDINSASNSYMDPSGVMPVYGAPGLPSVSQDLCNAIKCGATSADLATKLACSNTYGAGVWDLCTDPACAPYRGTSCAMPSVPTITQQPQTTPAGSGLTPAALTPAFPVITGPPSPLIVTQPDFLCMFNSWVSANPVIASLAAVGVFMLVSGGKK